MRYPNYEPNYFGIILLTILVLYRGYITYKDCRLQSLYGDGYESMIRVVDEVKENRSIEFLF